MKEPVEGNGDRGGKEVVKFRKPGTFKKLGGYEGTVTKGKPGCFQVVILKTFDLESAPYTVAALTPAPNQTRLSLKSDWEFMRDFFNDSFSGHSFSITKSVEVEGGKKGEKKIVEVGTSAWSFAEYQLQKCYPGFYNMGWGCRATLCARFLSAKKFKHLLCCRFFPCECPDKAEFGVWVGWICCLQNADICGIIHTDCWSKCDILVKDMDRYDSK